MRWPNLIAFFLSGSPTRYAGNCILDVYRSYRLRIGLIGASVSPGNSSAINRASMFARGLAENGNEVTMYIPFVWDNADEIRVENVHVCCFCRSQKPRSKKTRRYTLRILGRILLLRAIFLACSQRRLDWVFYYPGWNMEALLIAIIVRTFGIHYCVQHCDMTPEFTEWKHAIIQACHKMTWRWTAKLASVIVVISESFAILMKQFAPSVPIVKVPIMVDSKLWTLGDGSRIRKRFGIPESTKIIAYGGSLTLPFGIGDLIDAMALLKNIQIDWRFLIAGAMAPGPAEYLDVPQKVKDVGIAGKSIYVGLFGKGEMMDLLSAAHALPVPKRKDAENQFNMPSKLAECLASGKPVVTARIGEIENYLQHGRHALLYEPGDINGLANSILCLMQDDNLARRIGENGKTLAQDVFGFSKNMKHLNNVLRKIVAA